MAEQNFTFRSALHGFNRSDVITYLSELTAQHAAQLEEKDEELLAVKNENARMKQELASMRASDDEEPEAAPAPEPEELSEPEELPEAVFRTDVSLQEQELEAYRRAERCEREAHIRAGKVYGEACAVVEAAKARLTDQETRLSEMNDVLTGDIAALQAVMAQIRDHMSETQSQMQQMEKNIRSINS